MWIRRGWNSVLKINIVVYILLNNLLIKQHFPDLLEDHEMEKLRTKKDECVPQSIEPIEFKVSFPKIHPSDPEKLGMQIFKDKN
jgi:hypothetical protein